MKTEKAVYTVEREFSAEIPAEQAALRLAEILAKQMEAEETAEEETR